MGLSYRALSHRQPMEYHYLNTLARWTRQRHKVAQLASDGNQNYMWLLTNKVNQQVMEVKALIELYWERALPPHIRQQFDNHLLGLPLDFNATWKPLPNPYVLHLTCRAARRCWFVPRSVLTSNARAPMRSLHASAAAASAAAQVCDHHREGHSCALHDAVPRSRPATRPTTPALRSAGCVSWHNRLPTLPARAGPNSVAPRLPPRWLPSRLDDG